VIPQELGGGTVRAEGSVKGRITQKISIDVGRSESTREYFEERLCELRINILGFSVNIFKNYRNLSGKYDIIKSEEVLLAPSGVKFPIAIEKIYAEPYADATVSYTDTELASIASLRHKESLDKILEACEVLKISTVSEFTNDGYRIASDMLLLAEVGEKRSIE